MEEDKDIEQQTQTSVAPTPVEGEKIEESSAGNLENADAVANQDESQEVSKLQPSSEIDKNSENETTSIAQAEGENIEETTLEENVLEETSKITEESKEFKAEEQEGADVKSTEEAQESEKKEEKESTDELSEVIQESDNKDQQNTDAKPSDDDQESDKKDQENADAKPSSDEVQDSIKKEDKPDDSINEDKPDDSINEDKPDDSRNEDKPDDSRNEDDAGGPPQTAEKSDEISLVQTSEEIAKDVSEERIIDEPADGQPVVDHNTDETQIKDEGLEIGGDNVAQVSLEEKSSKIVSELITNARDQISTEAESVPPPPSLPDDSAIEQATAEDTMKKTAIGNQPLNFEWTFGVNRRIPTLNLTDESRDVIAYASSNVAVLYDFTNNTQKLLQGHGNAVTCIAGSEDKRWLVTGEKGESSCVIVWDTYSGIPVQVIFDIPGENGVAAVGMSNDAKYIVTVNNGPPQSVSVWDWTNMDKEPMYHVDLNPEYQPQQFTTFHPFNNQFFATNGEVQVIFFCWERGKLEYHCPTLNDNTFNKVVGTYSQTLFQTSKPTRVLTATAQGNLAVWEPERPDKKKTPDGIVPLHRKRALKLVRVMDRGITALSQTEAMVVSGNTAGHVTFFDDQLNLIMNYTELHIGPVCGVSFKYEPEFDLEPTTTYNAYPVDSTISSKRFIVRDFVVSTKSSEVVHIKTAGTVITKLLREHDAPVHAVAASPSKPWVCIGSFAGLLKLWDYSTKEVLVTRLFENRAKIRALAFSHNGLQIAVGMQSGVLHVLDAMSLGDEIKFDYATAAITHCAFSLDSKYLATADEGFTTTVYHYSNNLTWRYLGRYKAHYKHINDIAFGVDVDINQARLLTLGADRMLVEYDLASSSTDNLQLLSLDRIEQSGVPLSLSWYPPITKETFLLTGNDQYKLKMYNTTTKMCRKTLLGPTYGTPVALMSVVPPLDKYDQEETRLLCYATKTKIGVQLLPLDGNPHRSTSCVAHPHGISSIACGYDGNCVFTAGGREATVHMWTINRNALEAVAGLGGEGLTPFYGLLDGGKDGQMFTELENYFYYAQLRSQGINTTEEREVSKVVPLDQVPFIMRALGFYPSEQEIEDMLNEVKFSEYVETGQYVTDIDLADLIKLYINHRPAFGLSSEELYAAFETLGNKSPFEEPQVDRGSLLSILQRKGEHLTEYELAECLTTLLGQRPEGGSIEHDELIDHEEVSRSLDESLPEEITPSLFATEILGLNLY